MDTPLLWSWKEIASFFGKSVSTVQRWSRKYPDFPVRKQLGEGTNVPVWADKKELEEWWKTKRTEAKGI